MCKRLCPHHLERWKNLCAHEGTIQKGGTKVFKILVCVSQRCEVSVEFSYAFFFFFPSMVSLCSSHLESSLLLRETLGQGWSSVDRVFTQGGCAQSPRFDPHHQIICAPVDPSTQEAEFIGPKVLGYPQPPIESEAGLEYLRPVSKEKCKVTQPVRCLSLSLPT